MFEEAPDIRKMAERLVRGVQAVAHVDLSDVLILKELETKPKYLAKCFKFGDHPVGFYTDKKYAIVVYWQVCDYMSRAQLAVLVLHELMHIPERGDRLVDHNVQDFRSILGIDLDWSEPGKELPDLLGENHGRKSNKTDGIRPVKNRTKASRGAAGSREPAAASR